MLREILGKGLKGDYRERIADAFKPLNLLGNEMADILVGIEVGFDQQIILARGRVNLRDLLDRLYGAVGDLIGLSQLALHHHEDRFQSYPPRFGLVGSRKKSGK